MAQYGLDADWEWTVTPLYGLDTDWEWSADYRYLLNESWDWVDINAPVLEAPYHPVLSRQSIQASSGVTSRRATMSVISV